MPGNCKFVASKNNLISNAEDDEELFNKDANLSKQQEERAKQISFRIKPEKTKNSLDKELDLSKVNEQVLNETNKQELIDSNDQLSERNDELVYTDNLEVEQIEKNDFIVEQPVLAQVNDVCNESIKQEKIEHKNAISLDDAIKQGKALIDEIHQQIADIYKEHFANSSFAYSLSEVASDFERYLQALLLLSSSTNKELSEDEMSFIWEVLSLANVFEGTSSFDETLEKAKILTRVNPHALLLTVAVDKFYKKDQTNKLLTKIYDLYLLSCSLKNTKIIDKKQLLEAQYNFAWAQGVNIND